MTEENSWIQQLLNSKVCKKKTKTNRDNDDDDHGDNKYVAALSRFGNDRNDDKHKTAGRSRWEGFAVAGDPRLVEQLGGLQAAGDQDHQTDDTDDGDVDHDYQTNDDDDGVGDSV